MMVYHSPIIGVGMFMGVISLVLYGFFGRFMAEGSTRGWIDTRYRISRLSGCAKHHHE